MKQINGIWFPDDDEHFSEHIADNGDYQSLQFDAACSFMKGRKLFIDIGAHVGLWTLMATRAGFGYFISYEPNNSTFECLKKNVEGLRGMITESAVGTHDMVEVIEDHKGNTGAVSTRKSREGVKCLSLDKSFPIDVDAFIKENNVSPNECLMKIDTEGSELDVIRSSEKIIKLLKPTIIVEQKEILDATNLLCEFGMTVRGRINKDVILTW